MESDMKKFPDLKTLTIGVLGLKISLEQYGPKDFQRTYQDFSQEP